MGIFGRNKDEKRNQDLAADVAYILDDFDNLQATPVANLATQTAPPANKVGRSTAYTAQGIVAPTVDAEVGSSQPAIIRENVPELVSPAQRRLVYGSMQNDAGVDVSLRAMKTPVLGSEFYMDPYSDDPQDVLVSQFIWENLAGGMNAPLINSIEDILRFFEDGVSALEMVFENRPWAPGGTKGANSKNYTMLKKLGVRPESSIKQFDYDDNGGPIDMIHSAIKADKSIVDVTIPIDKLLVFTFNRKGGDLKGKSILRTAYPHWYYKTHMYKIDGIQKERHAIGVPRGKLMAGSNNQDRAIMRTLLRNLRTNEEAFILQTPNVEIDFVKLEGQLVNVLSSAEHHNFMIMMNVMAQFLAAAQESGARATAATQFDMFMKALRYIANYICDVFNMYLIPKLVVYNFQTTNFPKLCVKNLGEAKDLQLLASAYSNLLAQGGITPDLDTENWFRERLDIPSKKPNAIPTQETDPNARNPGNQPGGDPTSNGNSPAPAKGNVKPGSGQPGKSPSSAN